jgi:uncharacterized protein (DUF1015 family)
MFLVYRSKNKIQDHFTANLKEKKNVTEICPDIMVIMSIWILLCMLNKSFTIFNDLIT